MKQLTTFVCLFVHLSVSLMTQEKLQNQWIELIAGVDRYMKYNQSTRTSLQPLANELQIPQDLFRTGVKSLQSTAVCVGCGMITNALIWYSRLITNQKVLRARAAIFIITLCTLLRLGDDVVCRGYIEMHIDIFIFIIKRKKDLNPATACSILLQPFEACRFSSPNWTIDIPKRNSFKRSASQLSTKPLKIIHLTDMHVDLQYQEGSKANCNRPLCCRNGTQPVSVRDSAGKWGDYRSCDMPWRAVDSLMKQIKEQLVNMNPANTVVYYTGDTAPHNTWEDLKDEHILVNKKVLSFLKTTFKNIKCFPSIGNHEAFPVNNFAPSHIVDPKLSTQWMLDFLAEEWSRWLPNETQRTIRHGGYYTTQVVPGLRLVSINSNVCSLYNWWLLYNNKDPYGQLKWLVEVLLSAERKNESVHILSHIPPGEDECLNAWNREYHKIIERFADTVTGQFNGHTHYDDFRIFYSKSNYSKAVNVAYTGGSFTTYDNLDPNYKIFDVGDNYEILDYEVWSYKVSEANNATELPRWYSLYKLKEAYNLTDLKPSSFNELVERMRVDASLLKQYRKFKVRDALPHAIRGCDKECLRKELCDIVTTDVFDKTKCNQLLT